MGGNNERLALCRIHLQLSQLAVMDAASHLDAHDRKSHHTTSQHSSSSSHHTSYRNSHNLHQTQSSMGDARITPTAPPPVPPPARLSNDALESLAIAKVRCIADIN